MKNILILNHHASIPKYGGGGRHHQFSKELSKRNYNVELIASSYRQGNQTYSHEDLNVNEEVASNYNFRMIKTFPAYKNDIKKRFFNYIDFKKKVEDIQLINKPDVILASSVHPFTWVAGYKLAKKYNAKFVIEIRDLWPLSLYEDINKILRPFIFSFFHRMEKKYYGLASAIVVTAPNAYKYLFEKYGINPNKIHFIPHSIDIKEFDENYQKGILKPIEEQLRSNFCVTYAGSLSKSEGLENFIYIADRLKENNNIKFLIIGSGSEKIKLANLIEELDLNNVVMHDRLPREQIPAILGNSSVLFTGLMERKAFKYGISKNKFYDYMAAKKPVIFMSNVEDSAIEKAQCGFIIKNHSITDAANKLKQLYNDTELYNSMASNGRNYVEEHHTIETITDKLLKAIL